MKRKVHKKLLAAALSLIILASAVLAVTGSSVTETLFGTNENQPNYKNLYEKVVAEDGFIYGVDYNWFVAYDHVGHNLGANHVIPSKSSCYFDSRLVYNDLYNIKALGFNAVNFWLFTWLEGIEFDANGNILGLDDYFINNLRTSLDICRELGLNIVLSIQPHLDDINSTSSKVLLDKYTQFLYNPTVLQQYITMCVQPVCELVDDYQDTVMIICLTVEGGEADVNDPDLGFLQKENFGTTWENYAAFLTAVNQKVKDFMPDMPTSVESVGNIDASFKYNSIGLDLIGTNRYTKDGSVGSIESRASSLPMYIGEYNLGITNFDTTSKDSWTSKNLKFYPNAREAGYVGAFYFNYCTGGNTFSLFDNSSSTPDYMRELALSLHFSIFDNIYERNGVEIIIDKPVMLVNYGKGNVYWIGSRTATSYKLERSADRGQTWNVLDASLGADDVELDNGVCFHQDSTLVAGTNVCYRVTAYDNAGNNSVSAPSNVKTAYFPGELIKDSGFESGNIPDNSNNFGWYSNTVKAGALSGVDVHSGNLSFRLSYTNGNYGKLLQEVDVSQNATYGLSYWVNGTGSTYSVCVFNSSMSNTIASFYTGNTNGWIKSNRTFNSGSNSKVYICIQFGITQDDVAYFDDFSLKEIK